MGTESYFEDINAVITGKLYNAKKEIKAAMAWFTDPDLIDLLASKAKIGVNVELIISDNEDNRKANYEPLEQAGVNMMYYPQKGYGAMHHKFCVIDKEMVITGSYNWTINAKRNNGENIIISKDKEVVNQYLGEFSNIWHSLENGLPFGTPVQRPERAEIEDITSKDEKLDYKPSSKPSMIDEFEKEWNIYLNSHVLNYDKEGLKLEGKQWAENTKGNPEVIYKYLDTIYQSLLLDTTVDEQEVELLQKRLEQKMTFHQDKINEDTVSSLRVVEKDKIAKAKTLENTIVNLKNTQEKLEAEKKAIETVKIPLIEEDKNKLKASIEKLSIEITPPPLRRRIYIEIFMLAILSCYLFVFYSSVIYTILYGAQDAKMYLEVQGQIPQVEVFNGQALSLAIDKGWSVLLFVILFTILPFVFGYLSHQLYRVSKLRWAFLYLSTAIILDALLAYLIAKNTYMIDYMASREVEIWEPLMVFSIARFYIVLFLGAVPYLVWGGLLEHIWSQLDRSSRSELFYKKQLEIKHLNERNEEKDEEIKSNKNRIIEIEHEIIDIKGKIENSQRELFYVDHELELAKQHIHRDQSSKLDTLSNLKGKILAYLNKDRVPVSYSALKDRINNFLGGWDEWLYSYYSTNKANDLVTESHERVNEWLKNKYNELED